MAKPNQPSVVAAAPSPGTPDGRGGRVGVVVGRGLVEGDSQKPGAPSGREAGWS